MSLDYSLKSGRLIVYDDPSYIDSFGVKASETKCKYGVVSTIYPGCFTTAALDVVLYKIENRIEIVRNRGDALDGTYYIINESDILFYLKEF